MCNQALTICANKYIFILNIYTHFYKYKCSNYKLLNVTVSENINICKPSIIIIILLLLLLLLFYYYYYYYYHFYLLPMIIIIIIITFIHIWKKSDKPYKIIYKLKSPSMYIQNTIKRSHYLNKIGLKLIN